MKQLLANLNWTFVKAWWERRGLVLYYRLIAGLLIFVLMVAGVIVIWIFPKPKPKELTPLDLSVILTEKVNKLNSQIRAAEKRIETLERLQAGELPQIHGGVSYETK